MALINMPLFVNVLARILIFCVIFNIAANIAAKTSSYSTDNKEKQSKPNIIFILADDLGFNDVPWHNKEVVAPNLQRLAQEGIILEQSYVQPLCTPSRAALMTGTYPFATGRQSDVLLPLTPTGLTLNATIIPQLLKPLGYATHAVGKWHLGFCNWKYTPTERGFDSFKGFHNAGELFYNHTLDYSPLIIPCNDQNEDKNSSDGRHTASEDFYQMLQKQYPSVKFACSDDNVEQQFMKTTDLSDEEWNTTSENNTLNIPDGLDFWSNKTPDFKDSGTYSTYVYASHIEDLLSSSDPEVPQFIYMAFQSVHFPLQVPDNYTEPYKHIKNKDRRTYLGMVTALDEAVGRIVAALKRSNRYNNSVIIFSTDNGGTPTSGGNNWPLRGNKTTLWEGGTRGAAFVHSPLLPNPGSVSNNLIHVTDWLATLVTLAGGTPPNGTDSVNQWDALKGTAKQPPRKEIVYNIDDMYRWYIKSGLRAGIRYENFKLLIGNPGPGEWTPPPETEDVGSHEDPSNFLSEILSEADSWDFDNHTSLIQTMKDKCKDMKCLQNVLSKYKLANKSKINNNPELWEKFMEKVKLYEKQFQNWKNQTEGSGTTSLEHESNKPNDRILEGAVLEHVNEEIQQTNLTITDFESVDHVLQSPLTFRLYNLEDDPEERNNLAASHPSIVISLLTRLLAHRDRYVPPDTPQDDPKGLPKLWGGVWSPGWC